MTDPNILRRLLDLERAYEQTRTKEVPFSVIVARYKTAAAQSFNTGARNIVDFGTVEFDPFSRVTTGAAWKFTAAVAGYYAVSCMILWNGTTTWADTESGLLSLYKNGSLYSHLDRKDSYGSASSVFMRLGGADLIALAIGDYIDVRAEQNTGGAIALFNQAEFNYINIHRLP